MFECRSTLIRNFSPRRPQSLLAGMNRFLSLLEITFRRDPNNFRPRINKLNSIKVPRLHSIGSVLQRRDGLKNKVSSIVICCIRFDCCELSKEALTFCHLRSRTQNRRRVETISSWTTKQTTCKTNRYVVRLPAQPRPHEGKVGCLQPTAYMLYILKKNKRTHQPLCTGRCSEVSHVVNCWKLQVHCVVSPNTRGLNSRASDTEH